MIILFEKYYHLNNNNLYFIFLGNGLKFFVESFLTVIFLIPILLFLYNRAFSTKERHLYHMILTHHPIFMSDHTFNFRFGNTSVYFCSRCSGVVIGSMISYFFTHLIEKIYNNAASLFRHQSKIADYAGINKSVMLKNYIGYYSYIILLITGLIGLTRFYRKAQRNIVIPYLVFVLLLIFIGRFDITFRALLEPLLIVYLSIILTNHFIPAFPANKHSMTLNL